MKTDSVMRMTVGMTSYSSIKDTGRREVIIWHEFSFCYKQEYSRYLTALFISVLCSSANSVIWAALKASGRP